MLESLPIPLWRIVVAAVGLFVGIKLIKHILMGGGKTDPYTAASCRCGWKGQVSRYRPACPKCGTRLNLDEVLSQERKPRQETKSRPVVEEQVMSQSRVLTVMFTDICGFTRLSEDLGPEKVGELLNRVLAEVADLAHRHGATVDKFIGDCIMALFGAPLAHEDDVARALSASLDMEQWLADYSEGLVERTGVGLGMHSGVNYGTVVAGGLGSDLRMDYTVIGDTVNVASRLESAAQRGETFVSETVHAVGRRQFRFREVEPLTLKGKQRPVPAFALVAVRDDPPPMRGVDEFELVLVGRDAQLAQVREAATNALAGSGGVVSLIGEPGVGKSRLSAEFLRRSESEAYRTLRAACLSYTTRAPYYLFQELLKSWAGVEPADSPEVVRAELRGAFASVGSDLDEWEPYLQVLLAPGDEVAAAALENLDPQTRQRLTDRAIVGTPRGIANAGPLVLAVTTQPWARLA